MAGLSRGARWRGVVWLRFTMWRHGLRRPGNRLNTVAGVALNILAVIASLALAYSFATLFRKAAATEDSDVLRVSLYIVLYILAFFAVVLPIFIGAGRRGHELSRLTVFPISRRSLFGLALAAGAASGAHLFWYPALAATAVWGVLLTSVNACAGMVILLIFTVLLVLWGSVTLMVLEAVMQRRSVRELVGVGAFTVLMAAALVPALIDTGVIGSEGKPVLVDILVEILRSPVAELPPSLTVEALTTVNNGQPGWPWLALAKLSAWAAGGLLISYWVFTTKLLEPVATGGARRGLRSGGNDHPTTSARLLDPMAILPSSLAAVLGKELRYLVRSTPGKLVLLVSPLFVVMIGLAVGKLSFVKTPLFGIEPADYAFYGVLLYLGLLSSNFLVNAYAWEGDGLKAYLMGPLPARSIILGKNLAVLIFQLFSLTEGLLVWSLVRGVPGPTTLMSGTFVFFCGLLVLMAAGNFTSIAFPVKRSISAVTNSASNIGTLVSFAAVLVSGVIVLPVLLIGMAAGGGPVQVLLLGLLVASLAALNVLLLRQAADLFEERSEQLTEVMAGDVPQ